MKLETLHEGIYKWLIKYVPNIFLGLLFLVAGLWFINLIAKWISLAMQRRNIDPSLRLFLESFIRIGLRVLLLLGAMQIIGIQMTMFAALVGSFGVAAGFALSGTLQNFASGILILLLKPFKVGDNIITQAQEGTVTSIQIFYTIVTTFDNKTIIVPNSKLSNEVIINISRMGKRGMEVELKFNYGINYDHIKEIITGTIDRYDNIIRNPLPKVGVSSLEPDGFRIKIKVWVKAHGFDDRRMAFLEKVMSDLKESGVKLPGMP